MPPHDFKLWPELTNSQMQIYYFQSPHKQITEPFLAKVVQVTDGDTIRVLWAERDFDFPVRMAEIAAAELDERGGLASQRFLSNEILDEEVEIIPTKMRVEKWGRLLANVMFLGMDMSALSIDNGHAVSWENREVERWS
ncbi:MAG: hypothetical protein QQN41_09730 [Nitrosopumilus sp.]